ncbi:MAG: FxLYD domain-containing protein [Halobacteriota archaeon]
MRRRRVGQIVSIGFAVSLSGCLDRVFPTSPPDETDEPLVAIVEDRLVRENPGTDEEAVRIEGIAENVSDRQLTYVELQVRFYDEHDEQLDSTVDHINDVTAGTRWEFLIEYPRTGPDAAAVVDYDLEVVTNI